MSGEKEKKKPCRNPLLFCLPKTFRPSANVFLFKTNPRYIVFVRNAGYEVRKSAFDVTMFLIKPTWWNHQLQIPIIQQNFLHKYDERMNEMKKRNNKIV